MTDLVRQLVKRLSRPGSAKRGQATPGFRPAMLRVRQAYVSTARERLRQAAVHSYLKADLFKGVDYDTYRVTVYRTRSRPPWLDLTQAGEVPGYISLTHFRKEPEKERLRRKI